MASPSAEQVIPHIEQRTHGFRNRASRVSRQIAEGAQKLPAGSFVAAAGISALASLVLATSSRQKSWASFVGLWAPSLLLMGIYAKLLRIEKKSQS
ncbi:hypothetical protein EBZ37_07310 [bacterium]|nr:hypothetical protein [bacterium]